jgi:hypothetical protein
LSVALPADPAPANADPAYLDWGGQLRPIFGGAIQKLNRLGDRFALNVQMPVMESADDGRIWVASLVLAQRAGAIMEFPQHSLDVGQPGVPVVDGADQSGSTLALRGFEPGYAVRFGQFFSLIVGGRRYLHMAAADVAADGDGRMALPIAPMLRVRPGNGALAEFRQPMIEGWLDGDRLSWSLDTAQFVGLSFSIGEAK